MREIKAIVFDFGNVIAFFSHQRTADRLAPHSTMHAEEILKRLYGGQLEDEFEANRIDSTEFLRRARRLCELTCSDEYLLEAYVDIFWRNPEVCDLLPRLAARYPLILGSNTTPLHYDHFRRQFATELAPFRERVLSYHVGARKPSAEFFRRCHELAGLEPGACLFVDDLATNVRGAEAVGLQGLVYDRPGNLAAELTQRGVRLDA